MLGKSRGRLARIAAAGLAMVLLAGCDGELSAREIEQTFAGNTVEGRTRDKEAYWVYFAVTGDLYMLVDTGFTDIGRWWVTPEGHYCRQWNAVDDRRENCFSISKIDTGYRFTQKETQFDVLFQPGNPKQLPRQK